MDIYTPFLEEVAAYINQKEEEKLEDICIILPNRRAGLFLKKYLAKQLNKTFFAPEIFSIGDFVGQATGIYPVESLNLIFDLFREHISIEGENAQKADEFFHKANSIIRDFNDIDNYLVNATKLFSDLDDARAIETWNPDGTALTGLQINYLQFYRSLTLYYRAFTEKLISGKKGYNGLILRFLLENKESFLNLLRWKKIYFAGFNALTKAEEQFVTFLLEKGQAEMIWDADEYYIKDQKQEAGKFLRKYLNKDIFNIEGWTKSHYAKKQGNIDVIGIPKRVGQAKMAGQIVHELINIKGESPDDIAVILNDESLLIPLLNSIPEEINAFNVTMGFPFRQTELYAFITALFELQINGHKYSEVHSGKNHRYYYKDILRVLMNQFAGDLLAHSGDTVNFNLVEYFKSGNMVYYGYKDIIEAGEKAKKITPDILELIFTPWQNNSEKALQQIKSICSRIKNSYQLLTASEEPGHSTKINLEYLFYFHTILNRLESIEGFTNLIENTVSLRNLLNQLMVNARIPFYGEPLKGLQIMGMLESQALDFKNTIVLSVNDDLLPSGKFNNSFVPYDIRESFGLPTYKDKNSIYAYHFYRLLQRSKNVWLIYNTEPGELGGGEKSRFISQLLFEMPGYNPNIKINEKLTGNFPEFKVGAKGLSIKNNNLTRNSLKDLAKRGISASAFITWINCPLQFCLKYLYKIKETEEVEENIEASTMGTVAHEVLNKLYLPLINKELNPKDLLNAQKEIEMLVEESFLKHYDKGNIYEGKNLLIRKVTEKLIRRFLLREKDIVENNKITIRFLEERFETGLSFRDSTDVLVDSVKLSGICDRIDEFNHELRIIDYKSGGVEQGELRVDELQSILESNKIKLFQVLFYTFLFTRYNDIEQKLNAGIFSLKNQKSGFLGARIAKNYDVRQFIDEFETLLRSVISDMFNNNAEYTQTEKEENCRYCSFARIC